MAGEAYEVGQFSDRLSQILKPFLLDTMPGVVCGRLRRVNQDSTHVATDASTGTFVICHALHRDAWVYEASIVVHLSARASLAGRVRAVAHTSAPELVVLHGLRIKGMADEAALAGRFGLDPDLVQELLLDDEAFGWVTRVSFADLHGWALTEGGYAENQRRLGAELDRTGARAEVDAAHGLFVDLNSSFLATVTNWQIRPKPTDLLAANDHTDQRWDARVVADLHDLDHGLRPVCEQLAAALQRFDGYAERYSAALQRVDRGERSWVAQPKIDSCHTVWMELHEDLLATLGLERVPNRTEPSC